MRARILIYALKRLVIPNLPVYRVVSKQDCWFVAMSPKWATSGAAGQQGIKVGNGKLAPKVSCLRPNINKMWWCIVNIFSSLLLKCPLSTRYMWCSIVIALLLVFAIQPPIDIHSRFVTWSWTSSLRCCGCTSPPGAQNGHFRPPAGS